MITLGIYGYKKYQKRKDKKKLNQNIGEAPPVIDQSAEFTQSPTLPSTRRAADDTAVDYTGSGSSRYSETASEPSSAVESSSATNRRSLNYAPSSTLSSTSSEYQAYQQYVERQSNSYLKETPDEPPTYQAALGPPPGQPAGTWIFVPAGGQIPFANGVPTNPLPPSPGPASAHPGSATLANELPASLPSAAYAAPTVNELPAEVPMSADTNAAAKTPRFELAADETLSASTETRRSESDEESSRGSGEIKRFELA